MKYVYVCFQQCVPKKKIEERKRGSWSIRAKKSIVGYGCVNVQ